MAKKCARCGHLNDEERFFCEQCGEALDENVRVIMGYEKMKKSASQPAQVKRKQDDDDDYVPVRRQKKKNSYAALRVVLGCLVVVGVVAALFLLPR